MRLLVTADLHYNHPKSKAPAEQLITDINRAGGDLLLLVGDTAVADADHLERCLDLFRFPGPKLFVAGNHELWTRGDDSHRLFTDDLPRRVRDMGWHWLESDPFLAHDLAIVGSIGWYDYAYAEARLGIPQRFYEAKISPGAAEVEGNHAHLFDPSHDIHPQARQVFARWNDGRFVKLHRPDAAFLDERLSDLDRQLRALSHVRHVVAAVHHVPFRELLPPAHSAQWDFARAYLGSNRIGELLLRHENVRNVVCGHSHAGAEAIVGADRVSAINIGSGYRVKKFRTIDVP